VWLKDYGMRGSLEPRSKPPERDAKDTGGVWGDG